MGGSIALACRRACPGVSIVGVDDPETLAAATARSVIDEARTSAAELVGAACDLIVLAVPIPAILDVLPALRAARALITDVGSTKRQIVAAAASAGLGSFVGGHPMAGTEHSGLAHARADLFAGRRWLFTPEGASAADLDRLESFVSALGARPHRIGADAHDRAVAHLSHLPQLLAVALMNAGTAGEPVEDWAAAGPAFTEMTRVAASAPGMWEGILATNADYVAEALDRLRAGLPQSPPDLTGADWIRDAFTRSRAARLAFLAATGAPVPE